MLKRNCSNRSTLGRLVIFLALTALCVGACVPPDQDPFYKATPQPGGAPGDVIDARESVFTLDPVTKWPYPGVNSWQVMYQSENAAGEAIAVSGTVLVPTTPWFDGERPIIGYSIATRGLSDVCAASFSLSQGQDYEGPIIADILARGWAVAISDYEGLGTPGLHTYMVGLSQGRAVLNMVRAAQRLPATGLSKNAPIGVIGYSQGGGAGGWASELANTYAPELNVVGAAVGGVPANLQETGESLDGTLFVVFALMTSAGLDAAYDELDLENYLNTRGEGLMATTTGQVCTFSVDALTTLINTSFTKFADYTITSPLHSDTWQARIAEQKLGNVKPEMPVFLYHPSADQITPLKQATQLRQDWCDLGAAVEWTTTFTEHLAGASDFHPLASEWLSERFAGRQTTGNCQ